MKYNPPSIFSEKKIELNGDFAHKPLEVILGIKLILNNLEYCLVHISSVLTPNWSVPVALILF